MFRSKTRDRIIPQSEHERRAGAIASRHGNAAFDRPVFDFDAFVTGVAYCRLRGGGVSGCNAAGVGAVSGGGAAVILDYIAAGVQVFVGIVHFAPVNYNADVDSLALNEAPRQK